MCLPLVPDRHFATYRDLTPAFLLEQGVRALFSDIDNTLAPYEQSEPDGDIRAWLAAMQAAGILVVFVSNNHADRVELFNRTLGCPVYYDAHKPLTKTLKQAMRDAGVTATESAFFGDQLFTDVWVGHAAGMRAYTVPPIRDKRDFFTRLKRWLEKPFFRAYRKKHKEEC